VAAVKVRPSCGSDAPDEAGASHFLTLIERAPAGRARSMATAGADHRRLGRARDQNTKRTLNLDWEGF